MNTAITAAVQCNGIVLQARKKRILNDVTMTVPAGSITGLLGPNGAGKSSLLRLITGLTKPDAGTVALFGQPAGESMLGQLAMLPDRGGLPGWLTSEEWLAFARGIYPDWNAEREQQLKARLKINVQTRIGAMSRGEEARLQLLTCLSRNAPLIILDEPFTGVDLISREQIASAVVEELADHERTFLIATHDIREMEMLFSHLILIENGGIIDAPYTKVEQLRDQGKSVESYYRDVFS